MMRLNVFGSCWTLMLISSSISAQKATVMTSEPSLLLFGYILCPSKGQWNISYFSRVCLWLCFLSVCIRSGCYRKTSSTLQTSRGSKRHIQLNCRDRPAALTVITATNVHTRRTTSSHTKCLWPMTSNKDGSIQIVRAFPSNKSAVLPSVCVDFLFWTESTCDGEESVPS